VEVLDEGNEDEPELEQVGEGDEDIALVGGLECAEANEAAIKLARLYGHRRGIELPTLVVTEASFHGRTLATLTATGNRKVQAGFEPLMRGFIRVPYGDAEALRVVARNAGEVVAVLVEPVQGEGGVNIPPPDYLNRVREICDTHGWLMMLDEIQTGLGRTGRLFAHQHNGILPDVMTLAKSLGNGVPIGACLARGEAAGLFGPGAHGSTFGGNPLACRAALTVLQIMERDGLVARSAALGARLLALHRPVAQFEIRQPARSRFGAGCATNALDVNRAVQSATAAALRAIQVVNKVAKAEA